MNTTFITAPPDCEIVSSRTVQASVDLVFDAWTNPDYLQKWWGPAGFTNTFEEFDLRPGGRWRFVMHGADRGHYRNECEFLKIERPHLIAWKRHSQPLFQVLAAFEEVSPGQTKIFFKMVFSSAKECDKVKKFAVDKNEENFDRLEEVLVEMAKA